MRAWRHGRHRSGGGDAVSRRRGEGGVRQSGRQHGEEGSPAVAGDGEDDTGRGGGGAMVVWLGVVQRIWGEEVGHGLIIWRGEREMVAGGGWTWATHKG